MPPPPALEDDEGTRKTSTAAAATEASETSCRMEITSGGARDGRDLLPPSWNAKRSRVVERSAHADGDLASRVRARQRLQRFGRLRELVAPLDVDAEGPVVEEVGDTSQALRARLGHEVETLRAFTGGAKRRRQASALLQERVLWCVGDDVEDRVDAVRVPPTERRGEVRIPVEELGNPQPSQVLLVLA